MTYIRSESELVVHQQEIGCNASNKKVSRDLPHNRYMSIKLSNNGRLKAFCNIHFFWFSYRQQKKIVGAWTLYFLKHHLVQLYLMWKTTYPKNRRDMISFQYLWKIGKCLETFIISVNRYRTHIKCTILNEWLLRKIRHG